MAEKLKVTLNIDDLSFEELEEFEDLTGTVMTDAIGSTIVRDPKTGRAVPDPDDPKGKPLREVRMSAKTLGCFIYLGLHRTNPEITYPEVRKMKMADIDFELTENKEENEADSEGKDE